MRSATGGWLKNQESSAERDIVVVIPGRDRSRAVILGDHYDTAYMADRFYRELVESQNVINRKHLGFAGLSQTFGIVLNRLLHGQTNFLRMLWKFNSVYDSRRQLADHARPVTYEMRVPQTTTAPDRDRLYILRPRPEKQISPG